MLMKKPKEQLFLDYIIVACPPLRSLLPSSTKRTSKTKTNEVYSTKEKILVNNNKKDTLQRQKAHKNGERVSAERQLHRCI
jgi:hypothetical protein